MMAVLGMLIGSMCMTCGSPDRPTAAQATPRAQIATQTAAGDGCARLHIRVGPGSQATVTAVDQGSACRADELAVLTDSAPVFDEATGVLRIPVVLRNLGSIAMGAPARLTFIADSANLFDQNGNLLPGKPDIVAQNADSANASGRIGVWRYDAYLAATGAEQVLAAGATSQRRWLEFRSTDWHNAVRISLLASAQEPTSNVVPVLPPEQIPAALMDSLGSIVMPSGQLAIPDLLGVRFMLGATQQERQAAIDAVGGVVVGGRSSPLGSDGTYYVLVPAQRSDSLLLVAAELLLSLPQVSGAEILYLSPRDEAAYRKPHDGAGFERETWEVLQSRANGQNWALERIAAPLAWGCESGRPTTQLAIVDRSYARQSEVDANVSSLNALPDSLGLSDRHGLRVASVLGAPANNGRGIAGLMWRSALDFRDWNANPQDYTQQAGSASASERLGVLEDHMVLAGLGGAGVINLSRSNRWPNSAPPDTTATTRAGREARTELRNSAATVSRALARLRLVSKMPLLVIAAGNDNIDASFSGYNHPARMSLDSAQVLVVGGIQRSGQRDDSSNFGALVGVYAPSVDVAVLTPPEVVTLDGGTSFAAPLVAGTAGLLLSTDPLLTASDLKRLLLASAVDSITEPNGARKPVLNAYTALKKAAERTGAPLCGNRVWTRNGALFVQRGALDITGEEIFSEAPGSQIAAIDVQHGGREIRYTAFTSFNTDGAEPAPRSILYNAASRTWQLGPDPFLGLDTSSAGAARSYRVQSHDGDSVLAVIAGPDVNGVDQLDLQLSVNGLPVKQTTTIVGATGLPFTYCSAILQGGCDQTAVSDPLDGFRRVAAAYPPAGDTVLIAVNRLLVDTQYVNTPGTCHGAACTTVELRYFTSPQRADLYRMPLSTLQPTLVRSISDSVIYQIGFSEDGREKVLTIGRSVDSTAAPTAGIVGTSAVLTCRFEWSAPTWSSLAALYQVLNASTCPSNIVTGDVGGGTFAPRRRGPVITRTSSRPHTEVVRRP